MWQYVVRRLAISIVLVFVVSVLTFVLQSVAPGDMAKTILSGGGISGNYTPEMYANLRHELGLDQPVMVQYGQWLSRAIRGDLGISPISGLDVDSVIASRLPVTLSLVFVGTGITVLLGVGLGTLSAVRGGWLGRTVDVLSLVGYAVPNFWLALVLMAVFAVKLRLLPPTGFVSFGESPEGWLRSLVLPVATVAVSGCATLAKQTRDSMLYALSQDYVRMLRANGASERSVIFRHGLRNAAIPVVTVVGLVVIGIFAGSVFIESVFGLPGMGRLAVTATLQHDLPLVQGVVVVFTLVTVAANLIVDLMYGWLNPKVRAR
jgi:peptide/nickel transport system permease protein